MKRSKETNDPQLEQDNKNKTSRRRMIKTAVASTAAITAASQLNAGKWAKPIIDSVVLPGHAATTDDTGNLPGGGTTTPNPCPNGALVCAADPLQVYSLRSSYVRLHRHDVTATVCPAVEGVAVGLTVTGVNVDNARSISGYLNGGSPMLTNASGVATFSEVVLGFGAQISGNATARLDLVFSSGSDECSLSLSFTESMRAPL